MDTIKSLLDPFLELLGAYLPNVFGALLVLVIGWFLAILLRKGLAKLLRTIRLDERLHRVPADGKKPASVVGIISNLVYYIFLLCVLLLVLDILGVEGVLDPVKSMLDESLSILPNVVATILIGILGYILAKMIAAAVSALTKRLDNFNAKLGLSEDFNISRILGQIVFLLVFIPILMAGLDALKIEAVSVPATDMLQTLLSAIPKIIGALLILAIAFFIGRFASFITTDLLTNLGGNDLPSRFGVDTLFSGRMTFSRFCGSLVLYFVLLAAAISASQKLGMSEISFILSNLLTFTGRILIGLVILAVGNVLATIAYRAASKPEGGGFIAVILRYAIIGLVLAMGLQAMGIADDIVKLAFGLTVGAIGIALALSFGLGGREAAGRQMEYWLSKLRKDKDE